MGYYLFGEMIYIFTGMKHIDIYNFRHSVANQDEVKYMSQQHLLDG